MTPDRQQRAARTALVAAPLAVLTLAGHALASGAIDLFGTMVTVGLSVLLALALTSVRPRALSWLPVLVTLLAGQALLHLVLTFAGDHAHAGAASTISPTAMLAGHGVAALVATVLVIAADRLLLRWCSFLSAVLGTSPVVVAAPATRVARAPGLNDAESSTNLLRHRVVRRGPPTSFALPA